ncbi:hypothetical protein IU501_23145 [Nocardia otitidiscaviarum]|uniref:hypothetical protein n=1 Tax=Nocardia otitidiscaviarum TaxID=1823 RepID=UPI0011DE0005|nr:hypothetical protein [Nocardia otitidiscaviarum]MBF6135892.1 hypothetical protein [Nocardia otitidiscaviarum]
MSAPTRSTMYATTHASGTARWAIVGGVATVFAVRSGQRDLPMPPGENGVDLGKCFDLFPDQRELFWQVLYEREAMRPGGPNCGRISGR